MHLWLVRHARPLVGPGICYGQTDLPADASATTLAAQALARELPVGATVYCSTLQRCELLAHALYALRADLVYKFSADLREMHFGDWEGKAWNDIPRKEIDDWTASFAHYRVGGHGESTLAVVLRVLHTLLGLHRPGAAHNDVAWITHAGVIRAVQWLNATVEEFGAIIHPTQKAPGLAQVRPPLRPLAAVDWPQTAPAFGHWQRQTVPPLWQLRLLQRWLTEPP